MKEKQTTFFFPNKKRTNEQTIKTHLHFYKHFEKTGEQEEDRINYILIIDEKTERSESLCVCVYACMCAYVCVCVATLCMYDK